jgi:type IV pilus assembly protein PilB
MSDFTQEMKVPETEILQEGEKSKKIKSDAKRQSNSQDTQKPHNMVDILIEKKLISKDQFIAAKFEAERRGSDSVVEILIEMGFITESIVYQILSNDKNEEKVDLKKITLNENTVKKIPREFASTYKLIAIEENDVSVKIATNDPYNIIVLDQVSNFFNSKEVTAIPYPESEILELLDKYYTSSYSTNILDIISELEASNNSTDRDHKSEASPIVRFVNALLYEALRINASDIHIEPDEYFVRVRLRIDGVLINKTIVHKNHWSGICVRIKVLSGMNIAESRKPQDGAINLNLQGRPVDFRVSIIPTIYGENIVIRILDRTRGITALEDLGFNNFNLSVLRLALQRPEGIIIVTGPTGSGKTTTLYSILSMINSIEENIMTLEEPVEYRLPIIRQSEINHRAGFDFAGGLRSLLRQDPDIIFLGEIRDEETAQTALRAAATGHQVFSTLHTNSAIAAITRLIDIGIQPFMLSGSLIAVIAQRLCRRLCNECKKEKSMTDKMKMAFDLAMEKDYTVCEAVGCEKCYNLGYKGRVVISEILFVNEELNLTISSEPTIKKITEVAKKEGFVPIQRDAILKIVQGITSWEEVIRVIDMTNYIKKISN